jgi:predicted enzyme related to lactoylglutathione lyase
VEMVTNALNWFEIPVVDFDRAKAFYSRIFDYDMPQHQMGPNLMGFLLYEMGKGIGGAIVQGEGYVPSAEGALIYLSGGPDLTAVLDRVEPAGGRVLLGKTLITPELGFFAVFFDSEGNRLALHSIR